MIVFLNVSDNLILFNVFIIWKQDWAQCVGFHLLLFCCWRMLETGRVKWQLCSRFWTQKYPENLWENKIKHNTFTLMTCLMILIDLYQPLWISMIFHCWMTWNIVMMFVVEDLQGLTASLHFHLGFTMLPIDPSRTSSSNSSSSDLDRKDSKPILLVSVETSHKDPAFHI